ncbi:hypothetical protein F5Y03DRAFT_333637 [Xylaria venustula]|nr:hypothetical protein F5Y03DRAFT_333637 [Xylaria venustula]
MCIYIYILISCSTMDVRPRVATAPDSTWGIVPKDAWADTYNPASTVQQGSLPYHTRQQQTALPLSSLSSQNPPPPEMPRPDTTSSSSSSTEDEKADRKPRTPAEKENEYIPKHFFRNYRKIASNSVYRTAKVSTPEPSDPLPGSRTASVDLPPRDTETPARAFPRRQEELAEKESITPDSVLKRQQRPNRGLSSRGPGSTESGTSPSTSSVSLPVANGPYFSAQAEGTELMSGVADQARDSYEYVMKPPSYKLGRDGKRRSAPPQGPAQVSSHSVFPLGLMGLTRGRVRDEKSSLEPIVTNSAINASSIETPKRFFDFSGGDPIKSHKPGRNNERSHRRRHLTPEEQAAMLVVC